MVGLMAYWGESHPPVATLSFSPLRGLGADHCYPRPKSVWREALMQAHSKLRRNCARVAPAGLRKVCVAKRPTVVHGRPDDTEGNTAFPDTTLVLGPSRSVFSTDAAK